MSNRMHKKPTELRLISTGGGPWTLFVSKSHPSEVCFTEQSPFYVSEGAIKIKDGYSSNDLGIIVQIGPLRAIASG